MSLHTELDIFKSAYDLLGVVDDLVPNFPRARRELTRKLVDETTALLVAIPKANAERGAAKVPHLNTLLDHNAAVQFLLRLAADKRYISRDQFARTARLTTSISKQAHGWKKSSASSPAA